jgi:acetolactate synthase-1/3 small subunit
MKNHVIAALVENRAGTLSRVAGLFSRRGYNIDSLTVGVTTHSDISRITITVSGDEDVLEQIVKQLAKLSDVISVRTLDQDIALRREIMLVKARCQAENRAAILEIGSVYHVKVLDISPTTITMEVTGSEEKLNGLITLLEPFGILELARTGAVALERGEAVLSMEKSEETEPDNAA